MATPARFIGSHRSNQPPQEPEQCDDFELYDRDQRMKHLFREKQQTIRAHSDAVSNGSHVDSVPSHRDMLTYVSPSQFLAQRALINEKPEEKSAASLKDSQVTKTEDSQQPLAKKENSGIEGMMMFPMDPIDGAHSTMQKPSS